MEINFNQHLNIKHQEIFKSTDRVLLCYGGAGAGKSFSIAHKIILRSVLESNLKFMIIRRTLPALRNTCIEIIEKLCKELQIPYEHNKQANIARIGNNCLILYLSCNNKDDVEKLKSITDVDCIWIEEATEIRDSDYMIIKSRLRGGKGKYKQLICSFNPVGKFSWVYNRFFQGNKEEARKLRYTVLDNPWLVKNDPQYVADLQKTREYDENYYNIYFLGEWGELSGIIYDKWDVVEGEPERYDEIIYGLDFGFSVDPAVLVKVYRKADEYWIKEEIYKTGLTNQDLSAEMILKLVESNSVIYADSAEPKSIEELYKLGWNIKPCIKGPDSRRTGIDYLKSKKIHIIDGSENIIKEQKSYIWKKDKDGNAIPEPISFNDHSMDAIRYAIHSHTLTSVKVNPGLQAEEIEENFNW